MQYKESLLWILDKECKISGLKDQDEKFKANIDFVHSLGLKCDCEVWPTLAQFFADTLQS